MRRILIILFFITVLILLPWTAQTAANPPAPHSGTILLILPGDPYLPLAEEIAQSEDLPLVQSWEDALSGAPETILWVASPDQLSDAVMASAGMALKQHGELPSIGIFTGSTLDEARELWQRGQQLRAQPGSGIQGHFFAANGEHPTDGAPRAVLTDYRVDPPQTMAMDRSSLIQALQQADYLTFTGHGSDENLRIDPETTLLASHLPELPPVIVSTSSCQTLRVWQDDSIALGFIHQGAAAYAGFVYSPMAGYMIGQHQDLPFRYTWPEFPIGQVVALQTRGTLQGYANFPFHYLMGDPRIALRSDPPYQVVQDEVNGNVRTLVLQDVPEGLIPVRVPDGGRYSYVEVPGFAATADGDVFFNARIQAASLGGDKYILVVHSGGDLTLRLHETPPWHWRLTYPLTAAFDHLTLLTPLGGGDIITVIAGALALLVCLLRGWWLHKRAGTPLRPVVLTAGIAALMVTVVLGPYQALRLPHAVVTTKPLAFNALWLAGVFLFTASGVGLYQLNRSWWGKVSGLLIGVGPALLPAAFTLAMLGAYNLLAGQQVGMGVYNLHLSSLPGIAAVVWLLALLAGMTLAGFRSAGFHKNR